MLLYTDTQAVPYLLDITRKTALKVQELKKRCKETGKIGRMYWRFEVIKVI